jgi:hypothetical protein
LVLLPSGLSITVKLIKAIREFSKVRVPVLSVSILAVTNSAP